MLAASSLAVVHVAFVHGRNENIVGVHKVRIPIGVVNGLDTDQRVELVFENTVLVAAVLKQEEVFE